LREIVHPPFRIVDRLDDDRMRVMRAYRSERLLPSQRTTGGGKGGAFLCGDVVRILPHSAGTR